MRCFTTLLAAVLSLAHVAYMKRVKTEAVRGTPATPAVREHYHTGVGHTGLANIGLANMGLAHVHASRGYSAPTALQPPSGDAGQAGLFEPPSAKTRWQDLQGGFVEENDAQAAAARKLAKAQRHIAKAKDMQKNLDERMGKAEAEMKSAQSAFKQASRRKETTSWQEGPKDPEHIALKAEEAATKAKTELEGKRDSVHAMHEGMDKVKAEMTNAKAELGAARTLQSKAADDEHASESANEAEQAQEELRHLADRHLHATSRMNGIVDWGGDFFEPH